MRKLLYGLTVLLFFQACKKDLNETPELSETRLNRESSAGISQQEFVPNEFLVKFKPGTSATKVQAAFLKVNGKTKERIHTAAMKNRGDLDGLYLVHTPMEVLTAISNIRGLEVEHAEPNYIYKHHAASNDPYFTNVSLWGMYGANTSPANQFGSGAATAWATDKIGTSSIVVGVIDEGVMWNHEDLAANIFINPHDPVDGIDNDGNGYVDDIYGWDFDKNDNTVYDGSADDHGTHVAGTIGAVGGNGKGVAGVCWNVTMINAKFLGARGGTLANAIKAIDYMTDLKTRHGLDLVATNNSWGGGGYSKGLFDAIERAKDAEILFIAAAGNNGSNNDASPSYPASYTNSNIIAVAAITSTGALASYSNFGSTSVDIGAPGSAIWSTVPNKQNRSTYSSYSGTSMATPHVTGAAALAASIDPSRRGAALKTYVLNSSNTIPTASLSGKCVTGARLNVGGY
jgi:subtilisin family serine protease